MFFLRIICLCGMVIILCSNCASGQKIMDCSIPLLQGDSIKMSSFGEKNILFLFASSDSLPSELERVITFHSDKTDRLQVFLVPVLSTVDSTFNSRHLGSTYGASKGIVVSAPVNGWDDKQRVDWLAALVGISNINIGKISPGKKLFINHIGRVYALFPPEIGLSHPIVAAAALDTAPKIKDNNL